MSKFNSNATIKTTNKSGYVAYSMDDKKKLVTQVLTSFFDEAKFYGNNTKDMIETIKRVVKNDPQFVSNLAVFARREFNMRSVAHVLVGYLANTVEGKPYVKRTVKGVTLRGDDATEILSFYLNTFGKPIPNSLRKGLKEVFTEFDAYTLAKYKGEGKNVKMRDILCLCRPSPKTSEQSKLWKNLLEGKIATPYTWETELSAKGNKKEVWEELIASHKLPYMAALRNMRNIVNAQPDNMDDYLKYISDPRNVQRSKQLPFRFLSAYNTNTGAGSKVLDALEDAAEASIGNLPKLPGKTVIAIDVSGSMGSRISAKSDVQCCDIAMMLGLIANKICEDSLVLQFGTKLRKMPVSKRSGLLYATTHESCAGGGTQMSLPFEYMIKNKIACDRIIILSDNECNRSGWNGKRTVQAYADQYRKETKNNIWVHAIDLQGYGTQQFAGPKTNIIAGWSEKVFDFILVAEQGESNLEKTIQNYTW